jgi:hypothetical protein
VRNPDFRGQSVHLQAWMLSIFKLISSRSVSAQNSCKSCSVYAEWLRMQTKTLETGTLHVPAVHEQGLLGGGVPSMAVPMQALKCRRPRLAGRAWSRGRRSQSRRAPHRAGCRSSLRLRTCRPSTRFRSPPHQARMPPQAVQVSACWLHVILQLHTCLQRCLPAIRARLCELVQVLQRWPSRVVFAEAPPAFGQASDTQSTMKVCTSL